VPTSRPQHRRWHRPAFAGVALGLGLSAATALLPWAPAASPASAVVVLTAASPTDGASLGQAPARVRLTFGEQLLSGAASMSLAPPGRDSAALAQVSAVGGVATGTLPQLTVPGTYRLAYRVVGQDAEPVTGSVTFTLRAGFAPAASGADEDTAAPPSLAAAHTGHIVVTAGTMLTLMVVVLVADAVHRRRTPEEDEADGGTHPSPVTSAR
jgi:methionine-rich copper-binding protein CopC